MKMLPPEKPGETFWMALSILCKPVEQQLELLGGVPSYKGDPKISISGTNADFFLRLLGEFHSGWYDEIEENGAAVKIIEMIDSGIFGFPNFHEQFVHGEAWNEIRLLARRALEESGLEPWPVSGTLDFGDFIELYD